MYVTEILNLFNLHNDPAALNRAELEDKIPEIAWEKYEPLDTPEALQKLKALESEWAKSPFYAVAYAVKLKRRFPAGENAIAKDAGCAYRYATKVLHNRFLAGEAAMS